MYSLREALAAFRRAPVLTALSAAMIALSLLILGLFAVATHNIRRVLDQVESRVEIVAYLHDDATPEEVDAAQSTLAALPEVRDVLYISRAQALELAREELTDFEAVFAELDVNPLPASFEILLHPGRGGPDVVRAIAERVAAYHFVEDVRYGREWLDKVYLLRRVAAAAAVVVGGAFAVVATLIIGTAVRMAIFARKDEIAIMRLVGATNGFIRRPFLLEGLFTGLLGGLVALPLTYAVYRLLSDAVFELAWVPGPWVLAGIAVGGILGTIASALAVHRHLQEI